MKLARVNTLLLVLIVLINGYVVLLPFAPQLAFWWQSRPSRNVQMHLRQKITPPITTKHVPLPVDNRLIIPSMQLDQPIIEGLSEASLMKGPWRLPNTSTPDKGGNTVIAGHRFTYSNPHGTFYFLDKLHVDDTFGIYWHGTAYVYRVKTSEVVPPTQTSIEDATTQPQVTLFSCTPLWWPKNRLVVVGVLERTYE